MKKTIYSDISPIKTMLGQETGREAMKSIFLAYYPRLAYFAETLLSDKQEAEDIASAALGKLWENMSTPGKKNIENIQAWLFTIVRNSCYNYLKHERVKLRNDERVLGSMELMDQDIEASLIEEDVVNKLFLEIYELPQQCKRVAELIYIHGCTPAEVSQKLGIAPSTVRSQQARAVELIRTALIRKRIFIEPAFLILFLSSLDGTAC